MTWQNFKKYPELNTCFDLFYFTLRDNRPLESHFWQMFPPNQFQFSNFLLLFLLLFLLPFRFFAINAWARKLQVCESWSWLSKNYYWRKLIFWQNKKMVKISKEKHATKQMFWRKHFEFSYMQIISLKNQQKNR